MRVVEIVVYEEDELKQFRAGHLLRNYGEALEACEEVLKYTKRLKAAYLAARPSSSTVFT